MWVSETWVSIATLSSRVLCYNCRTKFNIFRVRADIGFKDAKFRHLGMYVGSRCISSTNLPICDSVFVLKNRHLCLGR